MTRGSWSAVLCVLGAELSGLAGFGVPRLLAQAETAVVHLRAVTALPPAQDSASGEVSGVAAEQRITLELHDVAVKDALRAIATQGQVVLFYNDHDLPTERRVSVSITNATVLEALRMVLRGTRLSAHPTEAGIVIERRATPDAPSEPRVQEGSIRGRVTDAKTGDGVDGASVTIDGTRFGATTDGSGAYGIVDVAPGQYTIVVKRLGYERASRPIAVTAEHETVVDFALQPSTTVLDQVVVTGTVVPTAVKALPTPISVITADEIARQHHFTLEALIRQFVPTAVAHDAPNAPANSDVSVRGASSLTGAGDMKVFIDGVETTAFGSTPVDPASIDRIEVIRGPQAATIYGADAAGGVIQIFTKRGDRNLTRPQVDARVAAGFSQTPYAGYKDVLRQQYSGAVRGGGQDVSYNFGGSYTQLADFVPGNGVSRQSTPSVYGGMNFARGILTADVSARYYHNTIPQVFNPEFFTTGYVPYSRPFFIRGDLTNETYGARMTASPTGWWRNQLTLGVDQFVLQNTQTQPRRTTPKDTLRQFQNFISRKLSVGYNTTLTGTLSSEFTSSLTVGMDHYVQDASNLFTTQALTTSGTIETQPAGRLNFSDNSITNTGYFAQAQLGVHDMLFVTAGVRAENNSTFGADYGTATLPRVGVSLVRAVGAATLKVRASYGKSLRVPGATKAAGRVTSSSIQLANLELAPERQQGWDGGVDLVFGNRGSLSVSGFDQTAKDLIAFLQVASTPLPTFQNQNIGEVSNKGIEAEGTLTLAQWLELRAQYGYVRSRIEAVGAAGGQVQVGDAPIGVPAHTAGAALTITPRVGTTVTGGFTYVGSFRNTDVLAEISCLATFAAPACPASFLSTFSTRDFIVSYPGFAKFNVSVTHHISRQLEAFLYVDNLTNKDVFEFDNSSPMVGRTTMLGLGVTY